MQLTTRSRYGLRMLLDIALPDVNGLDGVVRLRGEVQRMSEVRQIEEAAMSVPGVKRVQNEIDVMNQGR